MGQLDAMGFGNEPKESSVAIEAPRATLPDDLEARLVVAVEEDIRDTPVWFLVGALRGYSILNTLNRRARGKREVSAGALLCKRRILRVRPIGHDAVTVPTNVTASVFAFSSPWRSRVRRTPRLFWMTSSPVWIASIAGCWWTSSYRISQPAKSFSLHTTGSGSRSLEKLHVEVAFLRGDANDHRTAHDFLEKIVSLGGKKFKKKNGSEWKPFSEPVVVWTDCLQLLASWGNRASHGGTLTRAEAERLISVAEQALGLFKCPECKDWVWASEQAGRDRVQCSCGTLRWKHG